jgi:hypothetical protein
VRAGSKISSADNQSRQIRRKITRQACMPPRAINIDETEKIL